jgi:hypothetical protein
MSSSIIGAFWVHIEIMETVYDIEVDKNVWQEELPFYTYYLVTVFIQRLLAYSRRCQYCINNKESNKKKKKQM